MLKVNGHVLKTALEFFLLAKSAEEQLIEIDKISSAYSASMAFSVELFLKSINAETKYIPVLEVGSAIMYAPLSEAIKGGHSYIPLWKKLTDDQRIYLNSSYKKSKYWYSASSTLEDELNALDGMFVECRYSYEKSFIDISLCERISFLAHFFSEHLETEENHRYRWEQKKTT